MALTTSLEGTALSKTWKDTERPKPIHIHRRPEVRIKPHPTWSELLKEEEFVEPELTDWEADYIRVEEDLD